MNQSSLFGRQQGGAFQAPNNNRNPGLFSFGQQSVSSTSQNAPFGQTSAFSQTAAFGQSSGQTTVFGQTPAFGQTGSLVQGSVFGQSSGSVPGPSSTLGPSPAFGLSSTGSQTPAFGQPAGGQSSTGFGSLPSFSQSSGQGQSSVFRQAPAFAQSSAFVQPSAFSQQPFGQLPQSSSAMSTVSGSSQPPTFGQPSFAQPSGVAQGTVHSRGFGISEFSFKLSDAAMFKPIFSASPELTNPQSGAGPETFRSSQPPVATSMESSGPSSGFPLLSVSTSGPMDFSFSQPAAVPSISVSSGGTGALAVTETLPSISQEFTFSQPVTLSGSNGDSLGVGSSSQATGVPSSPSSFLFTTTAVQEPTPLFGGFSQTSGFGQTSAFGQLKSQTTLSEGQTGAVEQVSEEAAFGTLGKGTKRKEETVEQSAAQGKAASAVAEETQTGTEAAPRQLCKRPFLKNRGPGGGLFRSALSGILRSSAQPGRREIKKEDDLQAGWAEAEGSDPTALAPSTTHSPATPPRSQAPTKEIIERAEEIDAGKPKVALSERRSRRAESTESLGGMSPSEATAIQCKNVPANLNTKRILMEHFSRCGKVQKIFCRPQKNLAIVHFHDHASAAKAKKRKLLHGHELSIFWQRKKQIREKEEEPPESQDPGSDTVHSRLGGFQSSSHQKPLTKPSVARTSGSSLTKGSPVKKASIVKSLQFDSDPQPDQSPEASGSERQGSSLPSSLLHLVGQVAETAEEKYRLLEQRDKILRQGRPRRTDLDMSKVFVGTCPDMCPEKERYMRETRKQLSSYEVIPNTENVDHTATIKEYSRSSADQEEPLPHELRPLPVLNMTMDYLVTQIMDQGEDNYRDWYDFVWNRTRGIRKDITQQHLCDPLTVSLIEKCTRFHIHCAHQLCQEPMMSFDAKINNENLTKCLQSLKEMYQDLANREVYCPCEAEFRQYNVLLKLNDGDILREVQQFRSDIRNSPEVKFAVQAFAALNNKNFVRFFKLVKAASYLAGCILHRYFNQVRGEALRALNMAYTMSSRSSTPFPVDDLVKMLMFRNTAEASDFLQKYRLPVELGVVELSRMAFQEPDLPLAPKRSMAIMGKRTVLIGQVVNGGVLPNPPQHVPVCSFDAQNKYRGDGLLMDQNVSAKGPPLGGVAAAASPQRSEVKPLEPRAQGELRPLMELEVRPPQMKHRAAADTACGSAETGESSTTVPQDQLVFHSAGLSEVQPAPSPTPPPPKPETIYSDLDLTMEVESLVKEVLESETAEVAAAGANYVSVALGVCDGQVEALVCEVVEQMLHEASAAEMQIERERIEEEKRKMEEARRRQEHEAFLDEVSKSLCSEITGEVLQHCIAETASAEIRHAQEEKAACVARNSEDVCGTLVEETLQDELTLLAREILVAEQLRIHKFIKRWRDVVAVRRQLKRQMRGFPAAPCCVDPRFKLQALAPSAPPSPCLEQLARGVVNLGHSGSMSVSCTRLAKMRKDALHQMKVHYYYQQLLHESVWRPLDLPTLVAENVTRPAGTVFWKAVLLMPSDHESSSNITNGILTDWLEAKFGCSEKMDETLTTADGHMQTLSLTNGLHRRGETTHKVHVCVKVAHGPLNEDGQAALEKQKLLMGTDALLMLLPSAPSPEDEEGEDGDVFLLSALLQLRQIQQASTWPEPLPLAVVVPGLRASDERLEEDLMLRTLVEEHLISEYTFVHIPENTNDLQGSRQVSEAVKWLAARSPVPVQLVSQTLVQFVEAGLCQEFSSRLHRDQQVRRSVGLPSQAPGPIIGLYNATLAFLAGIISSPDLAGLSWPVTEFAVPGGTALLPHLHWNSPEHLQWLRKAVMSLSLPEWDLPSTTAPWPQLVASIFQYMSQIPWSRHSQPLLMSRLENLLERLRLNCAMQDEADEEWGNFCLVPWDEIVALCIDHRLRDWSLPEHLVSEDAITDDGEILVYFQNDGVLGFIPPPCWLKAVKQTHRDKLLEKDESNLSPVPRPQKALSRLRQKLFCSAEESRISAPPTPVDITHAASPQDLLPHRILASIEEERTQSQRFEEQLQRWLDVDPVGSFSMPLFVPSSLLSVPEIMMPVSKSSPPAGLDLEAEPVADEDKEEPDFLKKVPVPVEQRLQELERLMSAGREEELACELKLKSLLNIVED